jgi:dynein heavy chain
MKLKKGEKDEVLD